MTADRSTPNGDGIRLSEREMRARRHRNWAIGLALAALVGLFYVLTIVKLSGGGH